MDKLKARKRVWLPALVLSMCAIILFSSTAHAETSSPESPAENQPDKLVIQLGSNWAGVEFQLKTDAGLYPAPIVVDASGILSMELGGSKTYTLTCLNSSVAIPDPEQTPAIEQTHPTEASAPEPQNQGVDPALQAAGPETSSGTNETSQADPNEPDNPSDDGSVSGIPTLHLVLFIGGMALAVGGLILMRVFKRRKQSQYDDDHNDEYDDY